MGLVLALAASTVLLVQTAQQRDRNDRSAAQAREYQLAQLRPETINAVASTLVEAIATADTEVGCFQFSPPAAHELAAAHGVADCPAAIHRMRQAVRDFHGYVNELWVPATAVTTRSEHTAALDGCRLELGSPNAGPPLGLLELRQQHNTGWLIVSYRPCP